MAFSAAANTVFTSSADTVMAATARYKMTFTNDFLPIIFSVKLLKTPRCDLRRPPGVFRRKSYVRGRHRVKESHMDINDSVKCHPPIRQAADLTPVGTT